ncbi:MAG TPA: flagellar regulator YcgR PilZN domain-containing protein, partial [Burkholderiaceae bacterium]|nr:flagellar regulator YcgR PilZN domain-containing protein [Burkholderiaceae bacterium]
MFEDTRPASLDALGSGDGLAEFRVGAAGDIRALLKQLMDEAAPLNLSASDGSAYTTTLWTIDPANARISFTADLQQPAVHDIVEADECVAVAYLD